MLSVLIPAYNYDITPLVNSLHRQAEELGIRYEIIVMEDGSKRFVDKNREITAKSFCKHLILEENIGRSAIRNKLADEAQYSFLLFLDCDVLPYASDFLSKYLVFAKEPSVVIGGRVYDMENQDSQYSLIRKYGIAKERNTPDNVRKKHLNPVFTSPNFCIRKSIFQSIRFDESIVGYGHEDTVFGVMLTERNIKFVFIDNPVVHIGLDSNVEFIRKTDASVLNLYKLYASGVYPSIADNSKLLKYFCFVKNNHLVPLLAVQYKLLKTLLLKTLTCKNPSLFLYDVYKLLLLCKYHQDADKLADVQPLA